VVGAGGAPVAAAGKSGAGEAPSTGGETAGGAGTPPGASGGSPPGPIGVEVYALRCAKCHGADGRGGMYTPEIVHPVREYASWVARHGRPYTKMPSFAGDELSDAELAAIFDYLDTPPHAATGHGLFLDYCGNCHRDDGFAGPAPGEMTKHAAEIVNRVRLGVNVEKFHDRQHAMPAFSKARLSDLQLQLITGYLLAL
jgi:mono/diheme cytochrome c family protein